MRVRVFVEFADERAGLRGMLSIMLDYCTFISNLIAIANLNGRFYAGRVVGVRFFDEERYRKNELELRRNEFD